MSFDFLSDSVLLSQQHVENRYDGISDSELSKELERYREHVLSRTGELNAELSSESGDLSIYFDTAVQSTPSVHLLKHCALYFDRAVVDDPMFSLTRRSTESGAAFNQFLGMHPSGVARTDIAEAAHFMRAVRAMTAGRFLRFAPVSAALEPPRQLPLTYSGTLYAERIPDDLRDWVRQRARVSPVRRHPEGGWYSPPADALEPTRAICISFEGYEQPFVYHLFQAIPKRHTEDSTRFTLEHSLPDAPPSREQFEAWVHQSINQAGGRILDHLRVDLAHAALSGSMLLTESDFIGDLLNLSRVGTSLQQDIAQLALRLDLPVLGNTSVDDLMRVRTEYGESFQSFRLALQRQLRELRTIADPNIAKTKLENLQHELEEVQVAEVRREIRRVQRDVFRSVVVGAASLAAIVPSQGWSLTGLIAAAASAYKAGTAYRERVQEHPAFFLWKLKSSYAAES